MRGEIRISGAKNATLPLMATCLLTDEPVRLDNVPDLADINTMTHLLVQHGVEAMTRLAGKDRSIILNGSNITDTTAPYDLVRKMRASVLVLGPLVARHGEAKVSLPGGCAIGTRPVDLHIKGLQQLGAEIDLTEGYILARAPQGLVGAEVNFAKVSVGATENLLMAATLAKGETQLINAAREPEITDLANCLVSMGARIDGIGTNHLRIQGVDRLHGTTHRVIADRIEAGTYAMAAAITGGDVELLGIQHDQVLSGLMLAEGAAVIDAKTIGEQITKFTQLLTAAKEKALGIISKGIEEGRTLGRLAVKRGMKHIVDLLPTFGRHILLLPIGYCQPIWIVLTSAALSAESLQRKFSTSMISESSRSTSV